MFDKFINISFGLRRVIIGFSLIIPAIIAAVFQRDDFIMTALIFLACFFAYWVIVMILTAIFVKE